MNHSSIALARIGRGLRISAVAIYVGWVIFSLCMFYGPQLKPGELRYLATKDLPVGYRLHSEDFTFSPSVPPGERNQLPRWADPTGKYLLSEKKKEQSFGPAEISAAPVIEASKGNVKRLFSLKKQSDLADVLNANSHVTLCSGGCPIEDARVLAVVCGKAAPPDCYAVLELTKTDESKLTEKVEYQLIPQRN